MCDSYVKHDTGQICSDRNGREWNADRWFRYLRSDQDNTHRDEDNDTASHHDIHNSQPSELEQSVDNIAFKSNIGRLPRVTRGGRIVG